jgi:hypothetical protein
LGRLKKFLVAEAKITVVEDLQEVVVFLLISKGKLHDAKDR